MKQPMRLRRFPVLAERPKRRKPGRMKPMRTGRLASRAATPRRTRTRKTPRRPATKKRTRT